MSSFDTLDTFDVEFALSRHRGRKRQVNEDAVGYFYPINIDQFIEYGALFVLADGVGSLKGSEQASDMAVRILLERYYSEAAYKSVESRLVAAINKTNARVYETFAAKSASTLVAVVIQGKTATIANIGDSRAYHRANHELVQITVDHVASIQQASGRVKNKLTHALGHKTTVKIDTFTVNLAPGHCLLMVSDGVTRYLDATQLSHFLDNRSLHDATKAITDTSNLSGGVDNISVVAIRIGQPLRDSEGYTRHLQQLEQLDPFVTIPEFGEPARLTPQAMPCSPQPAAPSRLELPPTRQSPSPVVIEDDHADVFIPAAAPPEQSAIRAGNSKRGARVVTFFMLVVMVVVAAYLLQDHSTDTDSSSTALPQVMPPTTTEVEIATETAPELQGTTPEITQLAEGMVIQFDAAATTYVRIGQNTVAFILSTRQRYRVTDTYEDASIKWYRLYDIANEQYGWITQEELPDFIPAG